MTDVPSVFDLIQSRLAGERDDYTLALTVEHAVGDALYAEGLQRFGEKGLVDLVILAGCYHTVCGMLNLFAVPAPDGARGSEEG